MPARRKCVWTSTITRHVFLLSTLRNVLRLQFSAACHGILEKGSVVGADVACQRLARGAAILPQNVTLQTHESQHPAS